jgi:membrane fusion protein, heavy metal efflux system
MRRLIILIAIVTASGCSNEKPVVTEAEHHAEDSNRVTLSDEQLKTAGVELGKVEPRQISGTIKVNGVLDVPPQQLVSISAPLGGFLRNTALLQGSRVRKGETIATVENLDFIQVQQDYLEAKGNFEFARTDYERQQELSKENINSQKTLQQARASHMTWQGRYNGLKEKLKVLNISSAAVENGELVSSIELFSPITGYVTQVNANIGKFVNPTDVLFEIVDTRHLHAELIVFEKDVSKLKIGQKVRFTLANETEERTATVYLIGREISADRTVQIHCHIDKEDTELLPGMYLNALVETGGASVPALPELSVIDYLGKKYVFVQATDTTGVGPEERVFEMTEVEVGNTEFGFTEIKSPNALGSVVVNGGYALLSKLKNKDEDDHGH